jgi:hypothetical protein
MVDAIGMYAGIKPFKNAREPNFSDMNPAMAMNVEKNNMVRNHMPGYFTPPSKTQPEFNDTLFRSTLKQVLPVKGQADAVRYGRVESDKNSYMYPQQGYARGQHLGLATDHDKPMDRPIMPISGFFDPNMVNVLGNLPG